MKKLLIVVLLLSGCASTNLFIADQNTGNSENTTCEQACINITGNCLIDCESMDYYAKRFMNEAYNEQFNEGIIVNTAPSG